LKTAVYPGSFDPVTLGHLDILERAARIFDRVTVVVMENRHQGKRYWFSQAQRIELLRRAAAHIPNMSVEGSDRLLAEYCRGQDDPVIIKGLRALSDFELEFQMALINRKLGRGLDTLFLTAGERFQYLSSSVVKEVGALGGDVRDFLPAAIYPDVMARAKQLTIDS